MMWEWDVLSSCEADSQYPYVQYRTYRCNSPYSLGSLTCVPNGDYPAQVTPDTVGQSCLCLLVSAPADLPLIPKLSAVLSFDYDTGLQLQSCFEGRTPEL